MKCNNPAGFQRYVRLAHYEQSPPRLQRIPLACPAVFSAFHYISQKPNQPQDARSAHSVSYYSFPPCDLKNPAGLSCGTFGVTLTLKMQIEPFQLDELEFAWCNRLFLRTRTHRRRPLAYLTRLNQQCLKDLLESYGIHVLDIATDEIEVRVLLSLLPTESVSAAASKTKGRISKWLNEQSEMATDEKSLARGYFAVTTGQSTTNAVEAYLDQQSEHHGYANRVRPPILVQRFEHTDEARRSLETDHAVTLLRYHLVLATQFRHGVFDATSGQAITENWLSMQSSSRFLIDKVTFVPDHVHLAVSVHPTVSPANVVLALMNVAQKTMWRDFETMVIKARVNRLWQQSAYVGSFGQLSSNAVSAYLHRWSRQRD